MRGLVGSCRTRTSSHKLSDLSFLASLGTPSRESCPPKGNPSALIDWEKKEAGSLPTIEDFLSNQLGTPACLLQESLGPFGPEASQDCLENWGWECPTRLLWGWKVPECPKSVPRVSLEGPGQLLTFRGHPSTMFAIHSKGFQVLKSKP